MSFSTSASGLIVPDGTTLENSGGTVRIASGAAGGGLTGGGGSALAVGAGTFITQNADDIAVNASSLHASGTHASRPAAATAGKIYYETDTGVLYRDSGSAWSAISSGRIIKTGDESVNNAGTGATLQNDNDLFFPIDANESWFVEAILVITAANTAMDMKASWTGPAGVTIRHGAEGIAGQSNNAFANTLVANAPLALAAAGAAVTCGTDNLTFGALFAAQIINGGTAGTINFQWAQNTADAGNLTVKAKSFLRLTPLT